MVSSRFMQVQTGYAGTYALASRRRILGAGRPVGGHTGRVHAS